VEGSSIAAVADEERYLARILEPLMSQNENAKCQLVSGKLFLTTAALIASIKWWFQELVAHVRN
jgi:hypothetical protein